MRFMSMIRMSENQGPPPQSLFDAMGPLVEKATREGWLVDTGGLSANADGVRVRLSGGKISIHDGPFSETKELVGGYAVMEFATKEQAVQAARDFVDLHLKHWPEVEMECEVRQIFGPND